MSEYLANKQLIVPDIGERGRDQLPCSTHGETEARQSWQAIFLAQPLISSLLGAGQVLGEGKREAKNPTDLVWATRTLKTSWKSIPQLD